jgi:fumarate hydratase class II
VIANEETCRAYVEISPSMATALNPLIGYDKAAEIAKRSFRNGVRCASWPRDDRR